MTGTRPSLGFGSLSFSVNRHGTVSTASPLCASAIRARQQNGLKRRSASTPARSYIVIAMAPRDRLFRGLLVRSTVPTNENCRPGEGRDPRLDHRGLGRMDSGLRGDHEFLD